MSFGAIGGAAIGLGGSFLSSRAQGKAADAAAQAAQFRPFGINTGTVQTGRDMEQGTLSSQLAGPLGQAQGILNQQVLGGVAAGPGGTQQDQRFQQGLFGAGRGLQGLGLRNVGSSFGGLEQLGNQANASELQALMQAQGASGSATALAGGTGMFGAGRGAQLLNQNFGDVRQQELDLLRAQARPGEERTTNSVLQNLFSTGRLGTTGGANVAGRLAEAQENADIGRQLGATQTAQGLQALNFGTGTGLLGLGQQGAGLLGNLGSQNLQNVQGANQGMFSRGQQRLSNAQGLFGFGGQVAGTPFDEAQRSLGLGASLSQEERAALALSINSGTGAAAAGGNVANALLSNSGSPAGSFFSELGGGLLQSNPINFGGGGGQQFTDFTQNLPARR